MNVDMGVLLFALAVIIALVVFSIKFKEHKLAAIYGIVGTVGIAVFFFLEVNPFLMDANQKSFEEYSGEFFVEEYVDATRGSSYCIFTYGDNDSVRYDVLCETEFYKQNIEKGKTYKGSFVLAKHSESIVDINITSHGDG